MRRPKLKPLNEQVVVVTGASSGIGLETARRAAARGAKVVLSSWDEAPLTTATAELEAAGADVIGVVCDVSSQEQVERLASQAVERFGRIDTWVGNAGIHIFGRMEEVTVEDARRVFDVNYWGVVHGARAAVPRLKATGGGALITVGSVLSSSSVPLQGVYGASKHAVKAFSDAVRMELQDEGAPISVTLIKPAAIHTPIVSHSKSYLEERVQLPAPLYHPRTVAKAILWAAEHPCRSLVVGGAGAISELGARAPPSATHPLIEHALYWLQRTSGRKRRAAALHEPLGGPPRVLGADDRFVLKHSLATYLQERRGWALGALAAATPLLLRAHTLRTRGRSPG